MHLPRVPLPQRELRRRVDVTPNRGALDSVDQSNGCMHLARWIRLNLTAVVFVFAPIWLNQSFRLLSLEVLCQATAPFNYCVKTTWKPTSHFLGKKILSALGPARRCVSPYHDYQQTAAIITPPTAAAGTTSKSFFLLETYFHCFFFVVVVIGLALVRCRLGFCWTIFSHCFPCCSFCDNFSVSFLSCFGVVALVNPIFFYIDIARHWIFFNYEMRVH